LLAELVERGLATDRQYLFVLDGGKALAKAVHRVFGKDVALQRCQVHKKRNVLDYLPKEHQERIGKKPTAAWGMKDYQEAHKALMAVHKELERLSDSAAHSLLEGMEQTLTVHRLEVPSELRRSLASTNVIESMFSLARHFQRNAKSWKDEKQVERCGW
jgi:transposase-like protein